MRLPPDDVGRRTPREIWLLLDRWEQAQKRDDARAGVVASVIASAYSDPKKRPQGYGPGDFFPSLKPPRPKRKPITEDMLRSMALALGARVEE